MTARPVRNVATRGVMFAVVGAMGFGVQLATLEGLTALAHWSWLPATIVAVELAVVHNFVWHRAVTWRDRGAAGLVRFARFTVSNGLASVVGNVAVMAVCVGVFGMPPLLANVLAVGAMTMVNFLAADRWVFAREEAFPHDGPNHGGTRNVAACNVAPDVSARDPCAGSTWCRRAPSHATALVAALLLASGSTTVLAAPEAPTLDAWRRYVANVETMLDQATPDSRTAASGIWADGTTVQIESGSLSDWHGGVFVPSVTLTDVLQRLQVPGTPPPQDDVLAARVLSRGPDCLRVYIRMARHAIVTATYDTEHEMTFRRRSATVATARSVATRIEEVGGGDRGFLWRLNSYWRYEERDGGVQIDLRSLTLSRSVPIVVRPIAGPIVSRVARESMVRTLEALRAYLAGAGPRT